MKTKRKSTLARLAGYIAPYKFLFIASIVCSLLYVPLGLVGPIFIGRAIDVILGKGDVNFAVVFSNLLLLGITGTLAAFLQWLVQVCTRKISAKASQDMRKDAFDRVNEVPLKTIDGWKHGDIVSRLVNDADAVAEGLLQGLTQLFPGVVTIITTLIFMFLLDIPIALVVVVLTPISIIFAKVVVSKTGGLFMQQSVAQGELSGFVGENVTNQSLLRFFDAEERSAKEFAEINQKYYKANFLATVYSSIINPATRLINWIVYVAVGIFGSIIAVGGGISIGGVSAFLTYANQYSKPFNEISSVTTQLQSAFAGARRLFQVIDTPAETPDKPNALMPVSSKGEVRADAVEFAYVPSRPLIQDFTIKVEPGQRVALVGPTGCGKTTIINLLMRFYEVNGGTLYVDETPITDMQRNALRGLFGMVLQETWLKHGTVRENIAYGKPDASMDEVKEAAKSAYAHNFIKRLPSGYDTVIETGGGNLSAGQKQLLCIARIMLVKPDMLILDEATSSIDTRTEMLIQKALDKLMVGRTSFVVAHRLSTIQNADIILVMKDGKIIEQGTHNELLVEKGFYSTLYNSQFVIE